MNKIRYILCLIICIFSLLYACHKSPKEDINDFETLKDLFHNPTKEYRTAPLFSWNTKITKELIDSTMNGLKENGFGGVFIHPRPGLVNEYISDEWFDLFKYTVQKGKELDMNVWIYDENSYPSGFAGGHVPALMPESYNQGLGLQLTKTTTLPDDLSEYYITLKKEDEKYIDITNQTKEEIGKTGEYFLFSKTYMNVSPWYGGYSYVDLLVPGVTEKFIDITLKEYEKALGEDFGNAMPGWFTDEPGIKPQSGIRWTPDLFTQFEKDWGYDLKENLLSLFEETGNWKQVRHNYLQTLLNMFIDRWAKPAYQYCEEKNLIFTGHYWEHVWPNVMHGGDNMAMYAWHHMPGIDMLFNRYNENSSQAHFGNVRSVKELRSAANQLGQKRTLCETYGGGGWDENFKDFKRLGDWIYALGVNFMNPHLTHASIIGARKYDYPPTFSEHSPWWPYFRQLNDHFARLSVCMSAGEQLNDILILEPTTSVWLYYSYNTFRDKNEHIWQIGESFQSFIISLEKSQVEYDLGCENIIKDHGSVENDKFRIGKRAYSKIVIPPFTENLNSHTFSLLKEYVRNNGKIFAYSKPSHLDGSLSNEVTEFFEGNKSILYLIEDDKRHIEHYFSSEIKFVTKYGNGLFHQRRKMDDGQVLFLVNSNPEEGVETRITMTGKDAIQLNTLTGVIKDYPEMLQGEQIEIEVKLPPAGSLLLYVFDKKQKGFEPYNAEDEKYQIVTTDDAIKISPDYQNVLTIDFCDLVMDNKTDKDMHVYDAADKAFKHHGFTHGNPWNTSVQYKDNIVCRDTFSTGGFEVKYKFCIKDETDVKNMQAVIERSGLYYVSLNGNKITPKSNIWWLDRDMTVSDIGEYVNNGENTLSLSVSPMNIHAEIEPVYITGNFILTADKKGWIINPSGNNLAFGSWKEQGWPFYSQSVTYKKAYHIENKSDGYRITLPEWYGTVGEVLVNGKTAGIIFAEPHSLDISDYVVSGINTIEVKIVGSNKNLIGPFHNNPPSGIVSPRHFRNIKTYPSGNQYHQLDYGLMEDFILEEKL